MDPGWIHLLDGWIHPPEKGETWLRAMDPGWIHDGSIGFYILMAKMAKAETRNVLQVFLAMENHRERAVTFQLRLWGFCQIGVIQGISAAGELVRAWRVCVCGEFDGARQPKRPIYVQVCPVIVYYFIG